MDKDTVLKSKNKNNARSNKEESERMSEIR